MAYILYLDEVVFPVTPAKITVKINGKNEKVTLINEGEANILKAAGLTDIEFELLLPNVEYPFAVYPGIANAMTTSRGIKSQESKFVPAKFYLDKLEKLKVEKRPFRYVMTRTTPKKKEIFDTNMLVSLEDYSIVEDAGEGFDVTVKVKLRQYREFVTKTCTIDISLPRPQGQVQQTRADSGNAPSGGSYTVVSGDSLWKIAKQFYGDGSRWGAIYEANKAVIGGNPNLIYPGQVLTIP